MKLLYLFSSSISSYRSLSKMIGYDVKIWTDKMRCGKNKIKTFHNGNDNEWGYITKNYLTHFRSNANLDFE